MTQNPITARPEMPVAEAQALMRRRKIHHLPVVDAAGWLVGIVTEKDLLYASPSPAAALSVYEMSYLLSKLTVDKVMTRKVITVTDDTPLEDAARMMADNGVGGLPVLRDGVLVGLITESDIFRVFVELFGARQRGVRATIYLPQARGELAKLSSAIAEAGGNIVAFGAIPGEDPAFALATIKTDGLEAQRLRALLSGCGAEIVDIREV